MKYLYAILILTTIILAGCSQTPNIQIENSTNISIDNTDFVNLSQQTEVLPGNMVEKYYNFTMYNITYNISIPIYDGYLTYYRDNSPDTHSTDDIFYNEFFDDHYDNHLIKHIVNYSYAYSDNDFERLQYLMFFVQSLEYHEDFDFIYSYEVLNNGRGMCTDKAFVMIKLMEELGYGTALLDFYNDDHMTAAIKCNTPQYGEYCIVDTTSYYISIGDQRYFEQHDIPINEYVVIPITAGKTYDMSDDVNFQRLQWQELDMLNDMTEEFTLLEEVINEGDASYARCEENYIYAVVSNTSILMDTVNAYDIQVYGHELVMCDDLYHLLNTLVDEYNDMLVEGRELEERLVLGNLYYP